jgi:predicted small lipoprotein YifL
MRRFLLLLVALAGSASCGLKGDLYLPPPPAPPAVEAPAERDIAGEEEEKPAGTVPVP